MLKAANVCIAFCLLFCAPAYAQFPPTLARTAPVMVGTFDSGYVEAVSGHHGNGAVVTLCVIPPSTTPIDVTWIREAEVGCYYYENLTEHDLGPQTGATGVLSYMKVDGQTADAIGVWLGWDNHSCGPFDGYWDWHGDSGHRGFRIRQEQTPRVFTLDPSPSPRVLSYVLGGSSSSSTWPSGHGYPLKVKAGAHVSGSWAAR